MRTGKEALGWRRAECEFSQKCPCVLARGGAGEQVQEIVGRGGSGDSGFGRG